MAKLTNHHLAYLCFLPPTILSLISGLLKLIPVETGTAGGIGFLVLIPLTLLSIVSIPVGMALSVRYRRDYTLLILSFLTVLYLVEFATEAGTVKFYNSILSLYGLLNSLILVWWFLFRRKRDYG